jgi:broad specificity phosphatase PhoE
MADAAVEPGGAKRSGAVILARHGRPALSRRTLLSAAEYRSWWADYEAGGLKPGQAVPDELKAVARAVGAIITSTRRRSLETGAAVGGACVADVRFIEAPLPPPNWPGWIRLPPMAWGFIARVWWWFLDHHPGEESRREAEARAEAAARRLVELTAEGQDVLVLAHGFFNALIARALRRQGWRCVADGGYRYWSARRFERRQSALPPSGPVG